MKKTTRRTFTVGLLVLLPSGIGAQEPGDSPGEFRLTADDPNRAPSPFIGNGRLGQVIPPLGLEPAISLMAGLYEQGPSDVPRIAAVPTWNAISVYDGEKWIEAATPVRGSASD